MAEWGLLTLIIMRWVGDDNKVLGIMRHGLVWGWNFCVYFPPYDVSFQGTWQFVIDSCMLFLLIWDFLCP